MRQLRASTALLATLFSVGACDGGSNSTPNAVPSSRSAPLSASTSAPAPLPAAIGVPAFQLSAAALIGRELFFDKSLSATGTQACATCHDPNHAYGPPNGLAVQLGGPTGKLLGTRAVPSLRYTEYTPGYSDLLDNADGIAPPAPGGGYTWDGRVDSLGEQAKIPLLSPLEMANKSANEVIAKVRAASYAPAFLHAFGAHALDDAEAALANVQLALQSFQTEDPSFHPYSSKFDRHEYNQAGGSFTAAEERGFKIFNDPEIGNCTSCHFSNPGVSGSRTLFTDFSFEAIGVPRNPEIPANRDRSYTDMGICGPVRKDHAYVPGKPNQFCGMFKTPTLRNIATRHAFFHNGVIHSLEQAVRFYNTRDSRPELWYPSSGATPKAKPDADFPRYGLITTQYSGGIVQKFDDLPAPLRSNIDSQKPLDGRAAGSPDPMTEQQVADLLCFLDTLTDDYEPGKTPTAPRCLD
ncbi:MAG: cytochrome c peroxidase [Pseudomonadota bacterium]